VVAAVCVMAIDPDVLLRRVGHWWPGLGDDFRC
jgi:hypothetical protein